MRRHDEQFEVFREMRRAFEDPETSWRTKYDLIFEFIGELHRLGVPHVDYYDPDTTYEEDTRSAYEAYAEAMRERARALGVELDDLDEDEELWG